MADEKRTGLSMNELLQKLIERDMILGNKDEAKALVDHANSNGYVAEYFEYRKRPHVNLKREAPHRPIDKPVKQNG